MDALNATPSHPDANSYATLAEAKAYFDNRTGVENWDKMNEDAQAALLQIATKQLDSLRFFGEKMFETARYYRREQNLAFPRKDAYSLTGKVVSAGANYLIDSGIANRANVPDDFFNNGFVVIMEGTGRGQTARVSDFEMATGKITVSDNWATQPDGTSQYVVSVEIPKKVKYALFEQALYVVNGGGERQRLQAEGVVEYSIGDLRERFKESGINIGKIPVCNEAKGYMRGLWTIGGKIL